MAIIFKLNKCDLRQFFCFVGAWLPYSRETSKKRLISIILMFNHINQGRVLL